MILLGKLTIGIQFDTDNPHGTSDDNFASTVKGVSEGRLIFNNLKRSIQCVPEVSRTISILLRVCTKVYHLPQHSRSYPSVAVCRRADPIAAASYFDFGHR